MSDDLVKQAIAELQDLTYCRCSFDFMQRGIKDPACEHDSAEALQVVTDRIQELEAKLQDMALDCLAAQGQAENFQMYVDAKEARIDADAKLAKVPAFLQFLDENYRHAFGNTARQKIRELHAELKGEKDE